MVSARYILLREYGRTYADKLFRILGDGPKIYSKSKLIELGYTSPSKEEYLIYEIEPALEPELLRLNWNYKELKKFKEMIEGNGSIYEKAGKPFVTSLKDLFKVGMYRS